MDAGWGKGRISYKAHMKLTVHYKEGSALLVITDKAEKAFTHTDLTGTMSCKRGITTLS